MFTLGLAAAVAQAQPAAGPRGRDLPEFDIRDRAAPVAPRTRALLDRRQTAADSFLAAARPGSRLVLNQHGLPKLYRRDGASLSAPSSRPPEEIAQSFLAAHTAIFPFTAAEAARLHLTVRDVTPDATFLAFQQTLDGIDVFNGQVRFTLNRAGEVVQAGVADVVPGLSLSTMPRLSRDDAVRAAWRAAGVRNAGSSAARAPADAELTIFPMDADEARLAWRISVEPDRSHWFEIVIDAANGALLLRHNLYVNAAQARVWTRSPAEGTRELVTFPEGWLPAAGNVTTGNNADAYVDANGDDRADSLNNADVQGGRALSAAQVFDYPFGDGLAGQDPRNFKAAAIANVFYFLNVAHDYYYDLGFTEAAGNFQTDNFGRGGSGNDPVLGEVQFGGFTDNAQFAPSRDGVSPRLRLGIFTRDTTIKTDDLDTAYEGQIVLHEYGHGVSNRLVGARTSTTCLNRIQSGAMGEGWSDYFAISYTNNPIFGAYTSQDKVNGERRHSYEGSPFTYEDIGIGSYSYEVHDDGEIWGATLWDLRKSLGQAVADRLVLNGLKSTPCHPSMTDARDGILTADVAANAGANRAQIWQVFARHGLGYSAAGSDGVPFNGVRYDAAADLPPDLGTSKNPAITSSPLSQTGSFGELYSYQVAASNPNGGTLAYTVSGPRGMTVDPATGLVRWVAGFTGQRVKVTVTDGRGGRVVHGFLLPVYSAINAGTPLVIEGGAGTTGYAYVSVPSGVPVLQVTLRNGTGDADLWVANPSGFFDYSGRIGNAETLSFASPAAGRWQIQVDGYETYAGVTLSANLVTPVLLDPGQSVPGLGGAVGSETLFRIPIPSGAASFQVSTGGGAGDMDLYLRRGTPALCQSDPYVSTDCLYDRASEEDGNNESITLTSPDAGDWYLDISGYREFSGVTLTTTLTMVQGLLVPTISAGGLVGGGGSSPPVVQISPGGYATIYGSGFAPPGTARQVQSADVVNGVLPTRLAGLCIDVDSQPAYLTFVSPGQVNFLVPAIRTNVSVTVQARTNCGAADQVRGPSVTAYVQSAAPEFLYWSRPADGKYPVVAVNSVSGAYVGPAGLIPGLTLAPAKPGDILTIYGVSFGPTNPAYAAGIGPAGLGRLLEAQTVRLGAATLAAADVLYAGVSPGTAGLYQLNIRVPAGLEDGNYALILKLGSFETPAGYLTVAAR